MFKFVSTLASATLLAVCLAAPTFAQDSSSTTSSHAAMKHSDSTGNKTSMAHGGTGHDNMAHGTPSSDTGMKHSDSMHHDESSDTAMKHRRATPHDSMSHDPKTSSP
jgi:hypothetical protein